MSTDEVPVEALITGGKASGGPPLGPALGPLGVPIAQVVAKINQETEAFAGLKVPVIVWVNKSTKPASFRIEVKTPSVSSLIIKDLGISKGSSEPNTTKVGDISFAKIVEIAKIKRGSMTAASLAAAVKTVLGTAVSMGVTIDGGKDPRVIQRMIDDGEYDDKLVEEN